MIATKEHLWAELNNLEFRARHLAARPRSADRCRALKDACARIKTLRDLEEAASLVANPPEGAEAKLWWME